MDNRCTRHSHVFLRHCIQSQVVPRRMAHETTSHLKHAYVTKEQWDAFFGTGTSMKVASQLKMLGLGLGARRGQ